MKREAKTKSKQSAALIELKHDAAKLLKAIKIARCVESERAEYDRCCDAIDRLETKRRALLRRPTIKTKRLIAIEERIDNYGQLLAIARKELGKMGEAKSEIIQAIANLQAKIANNTWPRDQAIMTNRFSR